MLFVDLVMSVVNVAEMTIQNDSSTNNSFALGDMVAELEYPECVVSVLTPDAGDHPINIHTAYVFFASQYGTQNVKGTLFLNTQKEILCCH